MPMSRHKFLPALALTCSLSSASAQVPNGGFEVWVNSGGALEPVGWLTYNDVPTVGGPTVEQGSPGNPGDHHVVITSRAASGGGLPIQGWVSAGLAGTHAGFPCTARPAILTGQWQYGIQPTDSGQVIAALSKWNNMTLSTDPIAFGSVGVTGSLSTWQPFSVPLTYLSADTPDTAYIQIVSSIDFSAPVVGSFMKVDDLTFSGSTAMNEGSSWARPFIFPNPGTDHFTIALPPGAHVIRLFDTTGREMLNLRAQGSSVRVDAALLPSGIYAIRVDDQRPDRWVRE